MDERGQSPASFSPPGRDASFIVTRYGGLAHIEATSVLTHTWLSNYASNEATWDGSALIVEMRFFADFVEAALADGLRFETISGSSQDDCPKLAAVEFDETHILLSLRMEVGSPLPWPGIRDSLADYATNLTSTKLELMDCWCVGQSLTRTCISKG